MINDEVNYHKKEVQMLRSEKESLEHVLQEKSIEVRKTLINEAQRYKPFLLIWIESKRISSEV